jgi:ankyrin repeat protein
MLFENTLQKGKELPLLEVLIQAGADVDFQRDGEGDTPLIGAANLGAEKLGSSCWMVGWGAKPELPGLFGETTLHWAALLGEDRLAEKLIENVEPNLKDKKYKSSSLGWAVHGCCDPPAGNHGRQLEVVKLLVVTGATLEPEWMKFGKITSSPAMLSALQAADR